MVTDCFPDLSKSLCNPVLRDAEAVLSVMKKDPVARDACIIGEVISDNPGRVYMQTRIGGKRIVDMLTGEQLPRIC